MSDLVNALTTLGLRHTAAHLDDVVALATKRRWSITQLLEHLVASEQQERTRRSLERRLLRSRLGRFTPMSDFDWAWPKRLDRAAVEATLRLDFLAGARNVVLVAPQGLGKTMIAQNIAHAAVLAGHPCSSRPPPNCSSIWARRSRRAGSAGGSTTTPRAGSS